MFTEGGAPVFPGFMNATGPDVVLESRLPSFFVPQYLLERSRAAVFLQLVEDTPNGYKYLDPEVRIEARPYNRRETYFNSNEIGKQWILATNWFLERIASKKLGGTVINIDLPPMRHMRRRYWQENPTWANTRFITDERERWNVFNVRGTFDAAKFAERFLSWLLDVRLKDNCPEWLAKVADWINLNCEGVLGFSAEYQRTMWIDIETSTIKTNIDNANLGTDIRINVTAGGGHPEFIAIGGGFVAELSAKNTLRNPRINMNNRTVNMDYSFSHSGMKLDGNLTVRLTGQELNVIKIDSYLFDPDELMWDIDFSLPIEARE